MARFDNWFRVCDFNPNRSEIALLLISPESFGAGATVSHTMSRPTSTALRRGSHLASKLQLTLAQAA